MAFVEDVIMGTFRFKGEVLSEGLVLPVHSQMCLSHQEDSSDLSLDLSPAGDL